MTRKRRRRKRGDARGERRDGGGGGSWNGMNSRGTRSGASGRQLRKTVQGEPSEITGGDDSIGNDGVNTASCGNIRRDRSALRRGSSSVSHLTTFFFFSPVYWSIFYSSLRMKRRKIDEFIYHGYIILI